MLIIFSLFNNFSLSSRILKILSSILDNLSLNSKWFNDSKSSSISETNSLSLSSFLIIGTIRLINSYFLFKNISAFSSASSIFIIENWNLL